MTLARALVQRCEPTLFRPSSRTNVLNFWDPEEVRAKPILSVCFHALVYSL
jgi:hypothetical protein